MKITEMRVTAVASPDAPLRNSTGLHEPYFVRNIVQLYADNGLYGAGEVGGGEAMRQTLEGTRQYIVGSNPYELYKLRYFIPNNGAFSALEVATLDLIGKATGQSVSQLLGGAVRKKVNYAAYLFYKYGGDDWGEVLTPEQMVELAEKFVERYGFQCLKVKGGVLEPDLEVETMKLLRKRFGPSMGLRLDPNAIWSPETSVRVAKKLEDTDLEYLEDPCAGITGMAYVAERTRTPLSTNMCLTQFNHFPEAVRAGAVQVVLGDHHAWGGLRAFQHLGVICDAFKMGLSQHSNNHLGISMAAMTHIAAVIPNLLYASDSHYPWTTKDVIKGPMLQFKNGTMDVPEGPGLGVEIDEDKLQELSELFQQRRAAGRDDLSQMRKIDPDWIPMRPRW